MPICPGCEQIVPYGRLDAHVRYCDGIWIADEGENSTTEYLERRLMNLEKRLDDRVRELETDVERRLSGLEETREERRTTSRE